MANDTMKNISKDMFELKRADASQQEKIERPSLTFWQDVFVRLRANKSAVVSCIILIILTVMALFAPLFSPYRFDQQLEPIKNHKLLPPRVPGLEKLGIFDGTVTKEVGEKAFARYKEGEYELIKEYMKYDKNSKKEKKTYKIKEYTYIKKEVKDEYYWFGTDKTGRDLWTRVWMGTRVSLFIGLLAALLDMLIGVTYGSISGFYGGKTDIIMMRITEVISGIPSLVIVILFLLVMDPGILPISLAIAISGWMGMARVVRAQILKLKNQEFLLAARTIGAPNRKLIFRHLLPNVMGQIIIMITFSIPGAIFYEAFLAFIGLGLPVPNASLGVLINSGYDYLQSYPYMMIIPSLVICFLMLSLNIFANGLRDALDPKMRNQ